MEALDLKVRAARAADAAEVGRVYIESWHDTYPGVLSKTLLCAMTPTGQAARWRAPARRATATSASTARSIRFTSIRHFTDGARDASFSTAPSCNCARAVSA